VIVRGRRYRFDAFEFDPQTLELSENGQSVRVQRQPAMVLRLLLERPGDLVTREHLRQLIWGDDRHVDIDRSVAYCLRHLRAALRDEARTPRYIETLRGIGYRFVGSVATHQAAGVPDGDAAPAFVSPSWWRRAAPGLSASVVAAVLILLVAVDWRAMRKQAAVEPTSGVGQEVLLRRAGSYLSRDRIPDVKNALAVYQHALAMAPDSARALAGVGAAESRLAFHRRDGEGAIAALSKSREARRRAPRDPDVLGAVAWSLLAAGRFGEAADAYHAAIAAAPDRPELVDELALLEYQRGRIDISIRLLARRWQRFDPHPTPAGFIGTALSQLGFDTEARGWQQLAADLAPDDVQARYLEASIALRHGNVDAAHRLIEPVAAQPDAGALVVWLAAVIDAQRRGPDAALPALMSAVGDMPGAWNVRSVLADLLAASGRTDEARQELHRTIETCRRGLVDAPDSPFWPRCLASSLAFGGDVEGGVLWYRRAFDLGWRRLASDRADGWLRRLEGDPRFAAVQKEMAEDLDRMRRRVLGAGVPVAPILR
jgi:DNA-binding winged helix-turn-helix (wHTH) protein/tetratricopeptide (TPR) repeat protein